MNPFISRLLEVVLPEGRVGLVLYEAYFDESGDDGGFPLLALGGYLVRPAAARALERHWKSVLKRYEIPYFHMKECAPEPPGGVLKGMPKERRIKLQTELMALIIKYVDTAIVCVTPLNRYEEDDVVGDPYTHCVSNVSIMAKTVLDFRKEPYKLSLFYESGHKNGHKAYQYFHEKTEGNRLSFAFVDKADTGMIQAADIIVWQYAKFIKDVVQSNRPRRKDFKFLMQKSGLFFHIVPQNRIIAMAQFHQEQIDQPLALKRIREIFGDGAEAFPGLQAAYEKYAAEQPNSDPQVIAAVRSDTTC